MSNNTMLMISQLSAYIKQQLKEIDSSASSSSSDEESNAREDSSSPSPDPVDAPETRIKRKLNRYKRSSNANFRIVKKFKPEKKDVHCIFGEYVASEIRNLGEFYSSRAKECIAAILSRAKTGRLGSHLLAVLSDFEVTPPLPPLPPQSPQPPLPPDNDHCEIGPSKIPMDNEQEEAPEPRDSSDGESDGK